MGSIIVLVAECLILHIIRTMGIWNAGNTVSSLMILLFSISLAVSIQADERLRKYGSQIFAGYLFRIAILYFDLFGNNILVLPQSGADSMMFYNAAERWALYGTRSRRGFFVYFMGELFKLIGVNRLYAQFLLMLLSIASLILFILIIDDWVANDEIQEQTAWILCLLPNFALLSSIFLRESAVTFLLTAGIYFFMKWMRNGVGICFLSAILLSAASCLFHSGCIGIAIGFVICSFIYDPYERNIQASLNGAVLAFAVALGTAFVFLNYGDAFLTKFTRLETMQDIANMRGGAGSSYVQYVGNSNNPLNMIIYTIPRIVYFLFSPFPWQWRGVTDIIAFFFSGLFYLVTIKDAIGYLHSKEQKNRNVIICLLIVAFFCTFIFAWGVSNSGTASRHRDKMVCLYGVIFALSAKTGTVVQESRNTDPANKRAMRYIY